jgi:acyl carrier protein
VTGASSPPADRVRAVVLNALSRIAPESDPSSLPGGVDVRDGLDIDSMDFMNFVVSLHAELGVDVPEKDYAKLSTIDGAVQYLRARLAAQAAPAPRE